MSIPIYIMEEHKEVFYCWHYMKQAGQIALGNNLLIRVDRHQAMVPVFVGSNFLQRVMDLDMARFMSYERLNNGNFLLPAIMQKFFSTVVWVETPETVNETAMFRFVLEDTGIITGTPIDRKLWRPVNGYEDRTADVGVIRGGINGDYPPLSNIPVVLDIDLNFFACDNSCRMGRSRKVEITEDEYNRFLKDTYHYCRIEMQGCDVQKLDGKFYLVFNPLPAVFAETPESAVNKIDFLALWLSNIGRAPSAITISRSRISGYLPPAFFPLVEDELLKRLKSIYDVNIVCRPDF